MTSRDPPSNYEALKDIAKAARKIKASPPITPPTIAPVLLTEEFDAASGVDVTEKDAASAVELDVPVEEGEVFDGVAVVGMEELDEIGLYKTPRLRVEREDLFGKLETEATKRNESQDRESMQAKEKEATGFIPCDGGKACSFTASIGAEVGIDTIRRKAAAGCWNDIRRAKSPESVYGIDPASKAVLCSSRLIWVPIQKTTGRTEGGYLTSPKPIPRLQSAVFEKTEASREREARGLRTARSKDLLPNGQHRT
ncbi:hypothetical protein MMC29_006206 [Sticta canariensis]|nr:hypothetical protein [Sticta canariensis]